MTQHVPNAITALRGLCGPLVALLLMGGVHLPGTTWEANKVAFWVFLFAIVTDLLDGWAARLLQAFHPAGLWLDPFADKMLTDFTWLALGWVGFAPVWICSLMILRDVAILLVWGWVLATGSELRWSPTPAGQIMVAFEGTALCVFLYHGPWLDVHWPTVGTVLGSVALVLSIVSLAEYAFRGPEHR